MALRFKPRLLARSPVATQRPPYDPQRLAAITLAAETAAAVNAALSERRDEIRRALMGLETRLAHMGPRYDDAPTSPHARTERDIALLKSQIESLDAERAAHHERTAGVGALAEACTRWARARTEHIGGVHAES